MSGRDDSRAVEEFFATRRAGVVELAADDLTWRRITDRHHRKARTARWVRQAGVAATAAAVLVGSYLAWPQGGVQAPPPSAPTQEPEPTQEPAPTTDPAVDDLLGNTPETVPTDFAITRLSDAGQGHLFATGGYGSECTYDAVCAALISSADGGVTWEPVADLVNFWIDRVEFADAQVGYGWASTGATLSVTTDGGRTWQQGELEVERVWDVAVRGDLVVVLAGTGCGPDSRCEGLALAQAPVGQFPATDDLTPAEVEGPFAGASLSLSASETFAVGIRGTEEDAPGGDLPDGVPGLVVQRWQDGRFESVAEPLECAAPLDFAAAADADQVFLACRAADAEGAPSSEIVVASSGTGGRTWGGSEPSYAVSAGPVQVVAPDAAHLIVITPDGTLTSDDGGQTLAVPAESIPGTSGSLDGVVAVPGRTVYAWDDVLAGEVEEPGYWVSTDSGQTWTRAGLLP